MTPLWPGGENEWGWGSQVSLQAAFKLFSNPTFYSGPRRSVWLFCSSHSCSFPYIFPHIFPYIFPYILPYIFLLGPQTISLTVLRFPFIQFSISISNLFIYISNSNFIQFLHIYFKIEAAQNLVLGIFDLGTGSLEITVSRIRTPRIPGHPGFEHLADNSALKKIIHPSTCSGLIQTRRVAQRLWPVCGEPKSILQFCQARYLAGEGCSTSKASILLKPKGRGHSYKIVGETKVVKPVWSQWATKLFGDLGFSKSTTTPG